MLNVPCSSNTKLLLFKFKMTGELPHSDEEHWTVPEVEQGLYQMMGGRCVCEIVLRA